ncbi:putative Uncharacterized transcriptional regulatory protein [Sclerotinia borealis F-4128]|uniref:Putative Uncharacterized transcriptional regulatory protein n=1 Tax=Sclerotinia borealis (strain F-4128) TaxID=1432307 RepID=W9C4R1_SCLBF|nr:putative Uncharacterized transcriptional regulatory protein [Sclerotinia borealis F-4128]
MDSGGPPLISISLTDWDTEPPGNFDDDELLTSDVVRRPENEFTQTSLAIILRKTFLLRLAITRSLNDLSTLSTFEEAIRLDTELRSSYKVLSMELKIQLQEETSLGPVSLRPDLLDAVKDAKFWHLRCVEAGNVNMKGYLLICIAIAHIDALRKGQAGEELAASLVIAAEEAIEQCAKILENMAAQGQNEKCDDGWFESDVAIDPTRLDRGLGFHDQKFAAQA